MLQISLPVCTSNPVYLATQTSLLWAHTLLWMPAHCHLAAREGWADAPIMMQWLGANGEIGYQ